LEKKNCEFIRYSFGYKTNNKAHLSEISDLQLAIPKNESEKALQSIINSSAYCIHCRNIANQIGSVATTQWMEDQARLLQSEKLQIHVIKGEELLKHNMHLIHSVGRASLHPPRIVTMNYNGNSLSQEKYALIGKGVVYDTGGLNLKPTNSIEDMFLDKSGACTVLTLMKAISEMNLPINVVGSIALAENCISEASYRPGDILCSHKGLTVEVGNTDAEGRLCLADCMSYIQNLYKPSHMIDFATLTGACVVALGTETAGLFTNNKEFANDIQKAGNEVFEEMWAMPICKEHRTNVKGKKADLSNVSTGTKFGGACNAAAFLEKFVGEKVKWCHIDIAGYK
jgi:leucyl aminopeptidase